MPVNSKSDQVSGMFKGMYYEVNGTGRPIVALHGFAESIFAWRKLTPELAKSHQVHAIDLLGHGKAEKLPGARYDPQSHCDLIRNYIAEFKLVKPIIMGHSMGGGISLLLTAELCGEKQHNVAGMILLDSMFYTQSIPLFVKALRVPRLGYLLMDATPPRFGAHLILRKAFYDRSKITPEMIDNYAAPLQTVAGRHALVRTALQIVPLDAAGLEAKIATIDVPSLIIWGKNDSIIPLTIAHKINSVVKTSVLNVLPNCGHCPNEEQSQPALDLIGAFLKDQH